MQLKDKIQIDLKSNLNIKIETKNGLKLYIFLDIKIW